MTSHRTAQRSLATAAALALLACHEPPHTNVPDANPLPRPPHVGIGVAFQVGLMDYAVARVTTARDLPVRGRVVTPPAGSAWVVVEFRRTWRGETSMTAPAMPFEMVTRAGLHIPGDVDGLAAQIERANCGELGPSRLDPLHDERNCEVFAVPVAQLEGCMLAPSPAAHRGPQVRPVVDLGAVVLAP
ncbi:MAG: hypothetical protein WCJ30_07575 [Deltaproteobacteria bacterium]